MAKRIFAEHRHFWNHENRRSLYVGLLLLALSLYVQVKTGSYADRKATNFVGDLFLDNLPTFNLDFIVVQGALIFVLIALFALILNPRHLLFGLKAIALVLVARSFFISLTHLGVPLEKIILGPEDSGYRFYQLFDFEGDLFFSGHTALPFLMTLLFWKEKPWRYVFLAMTAILGTSVLLGHVHYSIDVFAAPFIVYGIFHIAKELWKRDYALLDAPKGV